MPRRRLTVGSNPGAIALTASLLILGGCATAPEAFVAPAGTPAPGGYAMAGERPPPRVVLEAGARSRDWWTSFGSPRLDEVIRLALENSPDIALARATLDRHQAEAEAAEALLKPQIGLNARVER
ncbi:MAG: TolC family protein, partial [Phenylobacterium sp.]